MDNERPDRPIAETTGNESPDVAFPPDADPEWQQFYRSIRQAMLDLRSD